MEKIYQIIEQEKIILRYANLLNNTDKNLYGLMMFGHSFGSLMVLDKSLEKPGNHKLHRCVASHELGHFYTSPRSNVLEMYSSRSLKLREKPPENLILEITMAQDEYKATAWATNFLMPNDDFNKAVRAGCQSVYSLACWFDVTEWFVYRKLGIIKRKYREMGIKMRSRDYFNVKIT